MTARLAATALVAALLLGASARAAPTDPGVRARVEGLLGAYRAVTVAEWRALGPGAAPVLEGVARDDRALPTWRARALAALGVLQPTAAALLVRQLAADLATPALLRSAAVDVAPGVLGGEAVVFLTPLLRDPDGVVRQRSAEALAASGAVGCRAVLAEARTRRVSDALARTANRCAEQLRTGTQDR